MLSLVQRLERRHRIDGDCWIWTGKRDADGYGRIVITAAGQSRERGVHVVAYELLVGEIPEGHELDHLCRNRACFNPACLEAVTHRENMLRSPTTHKTHCRHGHAMTPENTYVLRGHHYCRACGRERQRRYKAQRH